MKPEELVREDREKRPSRHRRKILTLGVAAVVAAVVATGVAMSLDNDGDTHGRPASARALPAPGVEAHPDQSPPKDLIAAGRVTVSAYYTAHPVTRPDGNGIVDYEWSLLNTTTGRYEKTDWAWVAVAPGMKTAAVLERGLPVNRVGLLNLATGQVNRWIKVDKGVGGVQFSPDGKRLVATTYSRDPDGLFKDAPYQLNGKKMPGPKPSRTGFHVIDVTSGKADFAERPERKSEQGFPTSGGRQDFRWSRDSKLLWEPANTKAGRVFYSAAGKEVPAPKSETGAMGVPSPDGKLVTGEFAGEGDQIVSEVLDAKTGKRAALVPGQQLLTWADDDWLIAFSCDPEQCEPGKGEFRNQLVLVSLDGKTVQPLTGFRKADRRYSGRWNPVLTRR